MCSNAVARVTERYAPHSRHANKKAQSTGQSVSFPDSELKELFSHRKHLGNFVSRANAHPKVVWRVAFMPGF